MKIEFAYAISPKAKIRVNSNGAPSNAFVKIALDIEETYVTSKYEQIHFDLIVLVASQLKVKASYVTPISLEEYNKSN